MNRYSLYYQAHVPVAGCGIFVALMRSIEHVAFDRTFDVQASTFEFLVPADQRDEFIDFMNFCEKNGLVELLVELPNRFEKELV